MNLRNEIRNAFDSVHASDELVERMKQELYQKDCHEEIEEICEVAQAPRPSIGRYAAYIAAALVLCVGCGVSMWNLRGSTAPLNPGTTVPAMTTATEETTESTSFDEIAAAEAAVHLRLHEMQARDEIQSMEQIKCVQEVQLIAEEEYMHRELSEQRKQTTTKTS